jgi:dihydroneopterin aldolase
MHELSLRDLSLWVRLGCTPEERKQAQEVRIRVDLRFHDAPEGIRSDELKDTICYARLSMAFRERLAGREFQLVERIAAELFEETQKLVEGRALISLVAHKVRPPVEGLTGGVEYRIGEFL